MNYDVDDLLANPVAFIQSVTGPLRTVLLDLASFPQQLGLWDFSKILEGDYSDVKNLFNVCFLNDLGNAFFNVLNLGSGSNPISSILELPGGLTGPLDILNLGINPVDLSRELLSGLIDPLSVVRLFLSQVLKSLGLEGLNFTFTAEFVNVEGALPFLQERLENLGLIQKIEEAISQLEALRDDAENLKNRGFKVEARIIMQLVEVNNLIKDNGLQLDQVKDLIPVGFLCSKITDKDSLARAIGQVENINNVDLDELTHTLLKLIDLSFLGQVLDLQEKLLSVSIIS